MQTNFIFVIQWVDDFFPKIFCEIREINTLWNVLTSNAQEFDKSERLGEHFHTLK